MNNPLPASLEVSAPVTVSEFSPAVPGSVKIYHAGTLRYTVKGVLVLSFWLLAGDVAFIFFEAVFSRFMPLFLKDLNASNMLIGIMTGSFAGVVNIIFLPNISQWSDRYRSRFGRRIPLLCAVTPLTAMSLMAVGFSPEIAGWLHSSVFARFPSSSVIFCFLGLSVVSFHFFNMVLVNSYTWLQRDVVPLELMSRFLSWFRVVGTISSCLFLWYIFPQILTHRKIVFVGVSTFYLIAFVLMCFNVKEGDYPEPFPQEERPGVLKTFGLYFRDCLSVPLYRHFFLAFVLAVSASTCATPFISVFARQTLGLTLKQIGEIWASGAAVSAGAYLGFGWLCDRFSPMSVALASLAGLWVASILAYLWVGNGTAFFVYSNLVAIPTVGWTLSAQVSMMRLFPKEQFGQFSSGLNVFACGAFIIGNFLIGELMDLVHSDYRVLFLWSAGLFALALYPMLRTYSGWKEHGGRDGYVAPLPPARL